MIVCWSRALEDSLASKVEQPNEGRTRDLCHYSTGVGGEKRVDGWNVSFLSEGNNNRIVAEIEDRGLIHKIRIWKR